MKWKILVPGLLVIIALVVVLASGFGHDPHALPSMLEGQPAPDFHALTLEGEPVSLSDFEGRKVVLNFWSTWCGPCKYEHPVLNQVAAAQGPDGAVFMGVLYGDEPDKARVFLQRNGNVYPTIYDPEGGMIVDYGVGGVPETYFISTTGEVFKKFEGALDFRTLTALLEATP